ncbi:MAG: type I restriction endonuclease subunit R [Planctomycetes bacterium]|nr:type I restriction endonuclease subunit R [Planctomycetota bacterium]
MHEHYRRNWQGTGFKAQLTAPSKGDALLYHRYLEEFGGVSSAVLISPPDQREGHEDTEDVDDRLRRPDVNAFWQRMMTRHGSEKQYQDSLIERFKGGGDPEILIVVDKLLTGFDAPRNTVLYITRSLKEHALLQAIARVNRLYEGKEFGYILDYFGVLKKLGEAMDMFGSFEGEFDEEDVAHAVVDVLQELKALPQQHTDVWQVFHGVANKHDRQAMVEAVADADERERFYGRLRRFARTMQLAMSCAAFLEQTEAHKVRRYKEDLKYFVDLRVSIARQYGEKVDFGQYQERIQKLLDVHVKAGGVEVVVDPVSIFDKDAFQRELDGLESDRSKALTIANRVKAAIHEHMGEDPAFYQRFSDLLRKAIDEFWQQRLDDAAFLARVREIERSVRDRSGDDVPVSLEGRGVAKAFFGIVVQRVPVEATPDQMADLALKIEAAVESLRIVNWTESPDRQNQMRTAIEDALFAWSAELGGQIPFEVIDEVIESCLDVARIRLP